jgi:hypothetical protein
LTRPAVDLQVADVRPEVGLLDRPEEPSEIRHGSHYFVGETLFEQAGVAARGQRVVADHPQTVLCGKARQVLEILLDRDLRRQLAVGRQLRLPLLQRRTLPVRRGPQRGEVLRGRVDGLPEVAQLAHRMVAVEEGEPSGREKTRRQCARAEHIENKKRYFAGSYHCYHSQISSKRNWDSCSGLSRRERSKITLRNT